ncbi:MAG: cytochrome c1 [Pseudomonadota bacterium]
MLKYIALSAAAALCITGTTALAAGGAGKVKDIDFSFEGPFGTFDENQLQRGLQVYTEICSSCHGLKFVPIRTLSDAGGPHLPEDQMRAYAEFYEVYDAELDDWRPAKPTDHFPESLLENAPDLSLMAKARAGFHGPVGTGINQLFKGMGGPEYIYSLLTGYTGEEKEEAGTILYENTAFPGGWISMAPPLWGEDVDFNDGHANDLSSISKDVAAFLMWTAEPKMMDRQFSGLVGFIMLSVLSVLLYLTNKKIWAPIKGKNKGDTAATPAE